MRSGLTDTYLRRRSGEETVTYADPRMEAILGDSQGAPIYQDHVLELMMKLAGYSSDEADEVRKILGKKKVEKIGSAGQEFVHRAGSGAAWTVRSPSTCGTSLPSSPSTASTRRTPTATP